jgi:hypothetical protein
MHTYVLFGTFVDNSGNGEFRSSAVERRREPLGRTRTVDLHLPWCYRDLLPVGDRILVPTDESQATVL